MAGDLPSGSAPTKRESELAYSTSVEISPKQTTTETFVARSGRQSPPLAENLETGLKLHDVVDFIKAELGIGQQEDSETSDEVRRSIMEFNFRNSTERLMGYIRVPVRLEVFLTFGTLYSLLVFVQWLVVVPARFVVHVFILARVFVKEGSEALRTRLTKRYLTLVRFKNDAITMVLTFTTLIVLQSLDESMIYHRIKSGTAVKLYFMIGLLEVADKLLSAAGQDMMRLVHSSDFLLREKDGSVCVDRVKLVKFVLATILSALYLSAHSTIFVYQTMALNVAVNSYSNALLTLILSSQFSELKGAVFKKLEREGLFQLTCADLNERFLLLVMLSIISSRNMLQVFANRSAGAGLFDNLKPNSWYSDLTFSQSVNNWIGLLIGPTFVAIGSEYLVDWLKHSFIVKFNRIRPTIYMRYTKILARDYIADFNVSELNKPDHRRYSDKHFMFTEMLLRRTGLPIFTMVIVYFKMTVFPWVNYFINSEASFLGIIGSLVMFAVVMTAVFLVKTVMSLSMLKWSKRILREHPATKAESEYAAGSPNIMLSDVSDVRPEFYAPGEKVPPSLEQRRFSRLRDKGDKLDEVVRFNMADKLIW